MISVSTTHTIGKLHRYFKQIVPCSKKLDWLLRNMLSKRQKCWQKLKRKLEDRMNDKLKTNQKSSSWFGLSCSTLVLAHLDLRYRDRQDKFIIFYNLTALLIMNGHQDMAIVWYGNWWWIFKSCDQTAVFIKRS